MPVMEKERLERQYIALPRALWQAIREYQREIGAASLAEAVRRLLSDALRAARKKGSRDG